MEMEMNHPGIKVQALKCPVHTIRWCCTFCSDLTPAMQLGTILSSVTAVTTVVVVPSLPTIPLVEVTRSSQTVVRPRVTLTLPLVVVVVIAFPLVTTCVSFRCCWWELFCALVLLCCCSATVPPFAISAAEVAFASELAEKLSMVIVPLSLPLLITVVVGDTTRVNICSFERAERAKCRIYNFGRVRK